MGISLSELRIGNWVYGLNIENHSIKKPEQIAMLTQYGWQTNSGKEGISPIPLAPEWLDGFGFEKDIKSSTYHKVLPDGHLQVETDYSFGICQGTFGGNAYERGNWYSGEFQYVHQLQNLYFALTGEELEIND